MPGAPRNRTVLVDSKLPRNKRRIGSGTLIGGGLVLTAAHTVFEGGLPLSSIKIAPTPQSQSAPAKVVWPDHYVPNKTPGLGLDAALLEIANPLDNWPKPVRDSTRTGAKFGRVTGRAGGLHCEAIGFPRSVADPNGLRIEHHMTGTINPASGAVVGRYDITVTSAVPSDPGAGEPSPWSGSSGAGVFVNGLLTAVLVIDLPYFPHNNLTAVPMRRLLTDPGVRKILGRHGLLGRWSDGIQSAEVADLFAPTWPIEPSALSPSTMLRADTEIVPFYGRSHELTGHQDWCCEVDQQFAVRLLFGPGGQGKTRLARELMHKVAELDWVTGFLRPDTGGQSIDFAPIADTSTDVPGILLITDYAETRTGQLGRLLPLLAAASDVPPIRLLLLARTDGGWWSDLRLENYHALATATQIRLLPPTLDKDARKGAFDDAVAAFAQALHHMRAEEKWLEYAAVVARPEDLDDDRYAAPLTLQMSAILALLQAGGGLDGITALEPSGYPLERLMLEHEQRYWKRTAARHRISLEPEELAIPVAAATFLGASSPKEALDTLARLPIIREEKEKTWKAVDRWLCHLYPSVTGQRWGRLEPDRIADHLIGMLTEDDSSFIDTLLSTATDEQAALALGGLRRAGMQRPHLREQLKAVLALRQKRLERAALTAALMAQNPSLTLSSALDSAYETVGFEYRRVTWEQWLGPDTERGLVASDAGADGGEA